MLITPVGVGRLNDSWYWRIVVVKILAVFYGCVLVSLVFYVFLICDFGYDGVVGYGVIFLCVVYRE